MANEVVTIVITGDSTQAVGAANRAATSIKGIGLAAGQSATAAQRASQRMITSGNAMAGFGRSWNRNVSLPLLAVGAASGKMAIDFEKAMRNVNSIAQLPEGTFEKLNKQVLAMAGPVAQAPKTLAEGLYDLVSSGFDAKESMVVLRASARAATAGLTTTEVSTKAVAAALNAYRRPASDAQAISDDLFQTVNLGVLTFDELASTIGMVLPAAATMGVDLKEIGAGISTLTKQGQSGSSAVVNLNAALTALIKPTKEMEGLFKQLGIENAESIVKTKGFQGALEYLINATDGTKGAIADLFPNVRAMRAVFGLTGKNAREAAKDLQGFQNDTGATSKVLAEQSKSLAFEWNQLKAEASVLAIEVGDKLIPVLRDVMGDLADAVKWFTDLPEGVQKTALEIGGLALALGPLIRLGGGMVKLIGLATGGFARLTTVAGTNAAANQVLTASYVQLSASIRGAAAAQGAFSATQSGLLVPGASPKGPAPSKVGGPIAGASGYAVMGTLVITGIVMGHEITNQLREEVGGGLKGDIVKVLTLNPGDLVNFEKSLIEGVISPTDRVMGEFTSRMSSNWTSAMTTIRLHQLAGLDRLNIDLEQALKLATEQWSDIKPKWRAATVQAMRETIVSIRAGMRNGSIEAKEGQEAINRILADIKMVKGSDPLGMAKAFARSFKQAGAITQSGMQGLIRNLKVMPKSAREAAIDSIMGMANAWAKGNPRLEQQVDVLRKNLENKFGRTNKSLVRGVAGATSSISNLFGDMVNTVSGYLDTLGVNVNSILDALGVSKGIDFSISIVDKVGDAAGDVGDFLTRQRGGPINLGAPSGDTVPAMLERGEYVLNRKAVQRVGPAMLDELNFGMAPRFQKGGQLGRPQMAGPEPLRTVGQHSADKAHSAAQKYVRRKSGGLGNAPGQLGAVEMLAQKMGLAVTSGYRPGDDGWHGVNRARDFGGAAAQMMAFAKATSRRWGSRLLELIYSPLGWSIDNGQKTAPYAVADHYDHVHVAMQRGGFLGKGPTPVHLAGGGFIDASSAQKNVALTIAGHLLNRGLNHKGAAGIIGNAWRESLWNPAAEGTGGGGLWGFTTPPVSLADLKNTAAAKGKSWTDIGFQTGFMWSGPEPASAHKGALNSQPSAAAAAEYFDTHWERSGIKAMADRKNGAREALRLMLNSSLDGGSSGRDKGDLPAWVPVKVPVGVTGGSGGTSIKLKDSKVRTDRLDSFGSLPDNIPKCRTELNQRRSELARYRAAYREYKKKHPDIANALQANITLLVARISALRKQLNRLLRQERIKKLTAKIAKMAEFAYWNDEQSGILPRAQEAYEKAAEYADQVVALEPEEPPNYIGDFSKVLTDYINGQEAPAYASVLTSEGDWRNKIIRAEQAGEGKMTAWRGQIDNLHANIEQIRGLRNKHPEAWRKQRGKIPVMQAQIKALRQAIGTTRGEVMPTWEDMLTQVQGRGHSREIIPALPPTPQAGAFGGVIFDTQMAIQGLGLKVQQATTSDSGSSSDALAEAIAEQNRINARKGAIETSLGGVLDQFRSEFGRQLPYVGAFADGGIVPGPLGAPGVAVVHGGERITPVGVGETAIYLAGDLARVVEASAPAMAKKSDQWIGRNSRRLTFAPGG